MSERPGGVPEFGPFGYLQRLQKALEAFARASPFGRAQEALARARDQSAAAEEEARYYYRMLTGGDDWAGPHDDCGHLRQYLCAECGWSPRQFEQASFIEVAAALRDKYQAVRREANLTAAGAATGPGGMPAEAPTPEGGQDPKLLALAYLADHPHASMTEIARATGVRRQALYEWPTFQETRRRLQGQGRGPRRGHRTDGGDVEAYDG
jgi:hypothetical protein